MLLKISKPCRPMDSLPGRFQSSIVGLGATVGVVGIGGLGANGFASARAYGGAHAPVAADDKVSAHADEKRLRFSALSWAELFNNAEFRPMC